MEPVNLILRGGGNTQGPDGRLTLIVKVAHRNGDGGDKGHAYHYLI
jgi:hypothetical protein